MSDKKIQPLGGAKAPLTVTGTMLDVIIALIPAAFAGVAVFGARGAAVIAITTAASVLFEYLWQVLFHRPKTAGDLSAAVTGLLLSFCLPVTAPVWICITGAFIATLVKQLFGGFGKNFLNPALTARLVLFLLFIPAMTDFTAPARSAADAVSTATPLAHLSAIDLSGNINMQLGTLINDGELPGIVNMLFGVRPGCIGETCAAALILGGVYLILRGIISFTLPGAYILTTTLLMLIASGFNPLFTVYEILGGGLLLGAFFMLTDPATSPKGFKWKLICGAACGIVTSVIRLFTPLPEGVCISVLLMNIACIIIEKKTVEFTLPLKKAQPDSEDETEEEISPDIVGDDAPGVPPDSTPAPQEATPETQMLPEAITEEAAEEAAEEADEDEITEDEISPDIVGDDAPGVPPDSTPAQQEATPEAQMPPEAIPEEATEEEITEDEISPDIVGDDAPGVPPVSTPAQQEAAPETQMTPEAITEEAAEEIVEEADEDEITEDEISPDIVGDDAPGVPPDSTPADSEEISENISEKIPESAPEKAPEEESAEAPSENTPTAPAGIPEKPAAARKTAVTAADYSYRKRNRRGKKKKEKIVPDFSEPLPDVIPEFLRREIEKNKENN